MAETQYKTRQEAQAKIVAALQDNSRKLRQAYSDNDTAAIAKYSKEYDRLTSQLRASEGIGAVGAGLASTAVGMLTGIPDIGISAYNYFAQPKEPVATLRERLLSAAQIPSQAVAEEDQLTYTAPDIAVGVVGLTQLAQLGAKGVKSWLQGRQTKELLSKLSPQEQNYFQELMLKGQGSPNTEVAATLAKLERDPKYAELLNTLKRAASEKATAGMAPAASRVTEAEAGTGATLAVKNKIDGLAEARKVAGESAFTQAFGYGEGRQLVDPSATLKNIDSLISRYSKQTTPNAERAVNVLQSIREQLQPTQTATIPGRAGFTTPRAATEMVRDASGMLRPVETVDNIRIPSAGGTAIQFRNAPEQLTVEQVQGILSEFGKKASQGDSLIKDLALSDEKIISSAIFGGMKDDLKAAFKEATGNDRTALGMLIKARDDVAKASDTFNNAVAQGLPAWFKDKKLAELNFDDIYKQYKSATPEQRSVFRSYVQNTEPEALKNFDSRVWQDFSSKYATTLEDGMPGTDLAKMAQDWAKTSPQDKDAIATALGQNLKDFDTRMKDALVFTRRVATGQPQGDGGGLAQLTREASAVVGASPAGYQGAKVTQLAGDILGIFRKGGISNDLAMKTLLTPEGANFLKNAKLSPGSQKTLQSLTDLGNAPLAAPSWMAVGSVMAPNTQTETPMTAPADTEQWIDPDAGAQPMTEPSSMQWIDPDASPITASVASAMPTNNRASMQRDILLAELAKAQSSLASTTDPAAQQRLQRDIQAISNEISRVK